MEIESFQRTGYVMVVAFATDRCSESTSRRFVVVPEHSNEKPVRESLHWLARVKSDHSRKSCRYRLNSNHRLPVELRPRLVHREDTWPFF